MERVREETGVDLGVWDHLTVINLSVIDLANVLWSLCKPQAKRFKMERHAFGDMLRGDVLDAAHQAYLQEYLDFVPSDRANFLRQRIALQEMVADLERQEMDRVSQLDKTSLLRLLATATKETSSNDVTDVPGLSESIQDPSLCGNSNGWPKAS
jgi:hypothetical protein